jgi:hypothetical protein
MEKFTIEVGQMYGLKDIPESHRELFLGCYHSGQCDEDVKVASKYFAVDDPDGLRNYLKEFGAWDAEELADDEANLRRMLWTASADLQERGDFYLGT